MQLRPTCSPDYCLSFEIARLLCAMINVRSDERRGELTIRVEGVWMDQKSPHN